MGNQQQGLTAANLAKEFGVTQADVQAWYCRGWIRSIGKRGAALKFNVRDCVERLMQRSVVDSRLVLPEVVRDMAVMMGVDQPDEGLMDWEALAEHVNGRYCRVVLHDGRRYSGKAAYVRSGAFVITKAREKRPDSGIVYKQSFVFVCTSLIEFVSVK